MARKKSKYNEDVPPPDYGLLAYQQGRTAIPLVRRHSRRIFQLARLAKGTYNTYDSQFRWFYGLFVQGTNRSWERLSRIQERVFDGMQEHSLGDCYNQAVMYYLSQASSWKQKSRWKRFNDQIRQTLGWRMFHWVSQQIRKREQLLDHTASYYIDLTDEDDFPNFFSLDLNWILNGNKNTSLFKDLTVYQRYIIYLYFVEGLSLRGIAETVCCGRDRIHSEIRKVIDKCRDNAIELIQSQEYQIPHHPHHHQGW